VADGSDTSSFSAAGQALGLGNNATAETDEQRKKRLASIAQAQSKLNGGQNFSAAGQALLNYGAGMGGAGGGYGI
jgi:hypothetical protein